MEKEKKGKVKQCSEQLFLLCLDNGYIGTNYVKSQNRLREKSSRARMLTRLLWYYEPYDFDPALAKHLGSHRIIPICRAYRGNRLNIHESDQQLIRDHSGNQKLLLARTGLTGANNRQISAVTRYQLPIKSCCSRGSCKNDEVSRVSWGIFT